MDNALFNQIYQTTPKFNPRLAGNISTEMMQGVEEIIVDSFMSSQKDYPEQLKFAGLTRPTPKEEYNIAKMNHEFDITKNTIYMVMVHFDYAGEKIGPFPLYLPYCTKGGLMVVGGSNYFLSPALIDPCLSVTSTNIFLSVNKDKLTFAGIPYQFKENGHRRNETVCCSGLYRGGKKKGPTGYQAPTHKMRSVLVHYLLAKYGLAYTLGNYFDVGEEDFVIGFDDMNESTFNPNEWTIFTTAGQQPTTIRDKFYRCSAFSIAVRNPLVNDYLRSFMAGLFYVVDHFPDKFNPENDVASSDFYKRLLATTILPYEINEVTAVGDLNGHLTSLDTYIDERIRKRFLAVEDVVINNIYDLFAVMVKTYQSRLTVTVEQLTTMYGKRLVLLPYVLEDIIHSIYTLGFKLQPMKNEPNFNAKKAEKIITHHLNRLTILRMKNQKQVVSTASTATDNLIAKISSPIIPQARISVGKMGRTTSKPKKSVSLANTLSASIAEVGDISSISGCATGRSRINLMVWIDDEGNIKRKPYLAPMIDAAMDNIAR